MVELVRKLYLSGVVFLIPQSLTLIRLLTSILVTIGHLILLQRAEPYAQISTAFVAVGCSFTLLCALLLAQLLKVYDELPASQVVHFFGMPSAFPLAVAILVFNFAVLIATGALVAGEFASIRTLKEWESGLPPAVKLEQAKRWHLFLSHNWDNQDAVATIKWHLQLLLPGVEIFLDVDNLESTDKLEEYVEASAVFLALLGSPNYLSSGNCRREVAAALSSGLPLVRVHESDPGRNGAPLEALEIACSAAHQDYLFPEEEGGPWPVVSWHRVREFQLVSLAQIAEQLLRASPAYDRDVELPLFVPHGLAWSKPVVDAPGGLYVYVSQANAKGAKEVLEEVKKCLTRESFHDADAPPGEAGSPTRWLLYLYPGCFEGEHGTQFADELEEALKRGVKPSELVNDLL